MRITPWPPLRSVRGSLLEIAAVACQRNKTMVVHHVVSICKSISVEDASDMPKYKAAPPAAEDDANGNSKKKFCAT
jgi:hypothetical protein